MTAPVRRLGVLRAARFTTENRASRAWTRSVDELVRDLERKALSGDAAALEKLKAAWGRNPMAPGTNIEVVPGRQIPAKQPIAWRWNELPAFHRQEFPKGECFYLYGMSVIPDLGQDRDLCRRVWNDAELCVTHHREPPKAPLVTRWPMRLIMANPDVVEIMAEAGAKKAYEVLLHTNPIRSLLIQDRPMLLEHLPSDYELGLASGSEPFSCLFVLFGIWVWTDPGEAIVRTREGQSPAGRLE